MVIPQPEVYFGGPPLDYASDHLIIICRWGPFLVPIGTTNLSHARPVSSSHGTPLRGNLQFVTDGRIEYQDDYIVWLGKGPQWVQIDLGLPCALHAIVIWHYYREDRVYFDVVIQTADDATFTTNVQTIHNADHDNSLNLGVGADREFIDTCDGVLIDPKGVTGRYVRLYSNGNTTDEYNHYIEVQVFGKPVK